MKCPKCGNSFFTMSVAEDSGCVNCGYSPTAIPADVMAEVEENLNRKKLKADYSVHLPSLPKFMPEYILDEDDDDELEIVSVSPVHPKVPPVRVNWRRTLQHAEKRREAGEGKTISSFPVNRRRMEKMVVQSKLAHQTAEQLAKEFPDEFQFLMSTRGRYILSQALFYGIQELESVTPVIRQEQSNIADMKFLRDSLFDFPSEVFRPLQNGETR